MQTKCEYGALSWRRHCTEKRHKCKMVRLHGTGWEVQDVGVDKVLLSWIIQLRGCKLVWHSMFMTVYTCSYHFPVNGIHEILYTSWATNKHYFLQKNLNILGYSTYSTSVCGKLISWFPLCYIGRCQYVSMLNSNSDNLRWI